MNLKIKRLKENAKLPTRASSHSAGLDLYAPEETLLVAGESRLIGLGIAMEIPEGYVGLIYARSGLSVKKGIVMKNAVGVIDSDYRGEVCVALQNTSQENYFIQKQERIAQLVVTPYLHCEVEEIEDLSETKRSEGGFGSSGTR